MVMNYNAATVFKSSVKRGAGTDATWHESIRIQPVAPPHLLSFEVYNSNKVLKDDLIGETKILDLNKRNNEGDENFELKLHDKQNRPKGKIVLSLSVRNQEVESNNEEAEGKAG